jgi:hypothetical protein
VPAVPKDRYYVVQWIDLFTQNFAYVGVRSTGFDAGNYLIAGPRWSGLKPKGIREVFHAETDIVGTLTRTALNGSDDVANVRAIQAQYQLQPLSAFSTSQRRHRRRQFLTRPTTRRRHRHTISLVT